MLTSITITARTTSNSINVKPAYFICTDYIKIDRKMKNILDCTCSGPACLPNKRDIQLESQEPQDRQSLNTCAYVLAVKFASHVTVSRICKIFDAVGVSITYYSTS